MRISSILLYVSSIQESVKFYKKVFRTSPRFIVDGPAIFIIQNLELILHEDPKPLPKSLSSIRRARFRGAGVILHISADSVEQEYDRMVSLGLPISSPPTVMAFGRTQLYVYDPDGYNVCIEQAMSADQAISST